MASFVLGAVGTALGGPLGGAAGALVGSYLDKAFIIPALFPGPDIEGPKIADIRLSRHDEGSPAAWVLGPENRVGSVTMWIGTEYTERVEEGGDGKGGGGGPASSSLQKYVDVALAFAVQRGVRIDKILAEGTVVYNRFPDVSLASALIACARVGTNDVRMRLTAPAGSVDLSLLLSGHDVAVSGFANAANNGTWNVKASGPDTGGGTYVEIENTGALDAAAGPTITLAQTLPQFDPAKIKTVSLYNGEQVAPDPVIEAFKGVGNAPDYRSTVYVVLEKWALADFGQRFPGSISAVLAHETAIDLQSSIAELMKRAGLASTRYDVSGISGAMRGMPLSGPVTTAQSLGPLLLYGDVITQETAGSVRFFHRKDATVIDIAEADLAADLEGAERPRNVQTKAPAPSTLPAKVHVTFIDDEHEDQGGDQLYHRPNMASVEKSKTFNLPIVMTAGKAKALAKRFAWGADLGKNTHLVRLPPRYAAVVQEGDVIRVPKAPGVLDWLLIRRVDVGIDFRVQLECTLEVRSVLVQDEESEAPPTPANAFDPGPPDLYWTTFESPPIVPDVPYDVPGILVPVGVADDDEPWPGAFLYGSLDDVDFFPIRAITDEATIGLATTVLAGAGINPAYFDRVSTVDVFLRHGELESRTEAEVLSGLNRAVIGGEIIGFATQELIAPQTYRLSTLLRGLRDTVPAMTTHVADEAFFLLNSAVTRVPFSFTALGAERFLKVVPFGGLVANYPSRSVTITGNTLQPFAGTGLTGMRDDSGNLVVTWFRRTRAPIRALAPFPTPIAEFDERYEIELWSGGVLKRTKEATAPTASYSESEQTTDGVTHFTGVECRVYQLSDLYGRGRALIGTV